MKFNLLKVFPGLSVILLLGYSCNNTPDYEIVSGKGIRTENGMVVSAHPEASIIGTKILIAGGNAFDASAATGFALAVCYPNAGNLGGGGLMVIRTAGGELDAIDYREKAPLAASRDMYLDENSEVIPRESVATHKASGVPGSVAGLITMHKKYGKLPFVDIIQPAIDLARQGFPLTSAQASSLNRREKSFLERNDHKIAFVKDEDWNKGDLLVQEDLAKTLERIRDNGVDGFYKGMTADLVVSEMKKKNGLFTLEDLAAYEAKWRSPLTSDYKNFRLIAMPPPSSGGVALIQLMKMVENHPLSEYGFNSTEAVHLMVEAERRVYADRAEYLGDPDFVDVPVDILIDGDYLVQRMAEFNPEKASLSTEIGAGSVQIFESEETTHYSVIDIEGNAASTTTTLNGGYGNGIVVEGAGFFLNNEMDDFSIKPGYPNIYGLLGGDANAIQPGKRMLSSMTPTIVEKEGELYLIVGTPGGSTIITSVFQVIIDVLEFDMDMQSAVNAGRFHHQWLPDNISFEEDAFDSKTIESLEQMGHKFRQRSAIGRVDAIRILDGGIYEAGADPRGDDMAAGY